MKNLVLSSALLFSSLMVSPNLANATTVIDENNLEFAKCQIKDTRNGSTFIASGNCKAVMKAYKEWIAMQ